MKDINEIKPGVYWIGAEDPQLRVFDDLFPTEHGTTYNSYLVKGKDKIAIIDTVKGRYAEEYLDKIRQLVDPAEVDYIIINHTEPDHPARWSSCSITAPRQRSSPARRRQPFSAT